jgi:hypothetical protein
MGDDMMMKIATVFLMDYRSKSRLPVGTLEERRRTERGNNQKDLLRLARERFAANRNDALNLYIVYSFVDKETGTAATLRGHRTLVKAFEEPAIRLGKS